MCSQPIGQWQAQGSDASLLLVRLDGIEGGLPSRDAIRPSLAADWTTAMQRQAVERTTQVVVSRYRFEEAP